MNPDVLATVIKFAIFAGFVFNVAPVMLWVERRGCAFIQDRPGPNRVGPLGLFQPLADAIKFLFKEDVMPAQADKLLFLAAPVLGLLPAMTTFVVVPFGPDIDVAGRVIPLIVSSADTGVLLFLALASLSVYSLVMAGYASNNKFSLLGGIRASAQLISYELAMTLSVVAVVVPVGSFKLSDVIAYQQAHHLWNVVPQILGFLIFLVASFAETNRLPFDLPEAESELVAGFHTEYSQMRFAVFFMAEYISMTTLSALGITLYFGGWTIPFVTAQQYAALGIWGGLLGFATLIAKISVAMLVFVWVRWTFPRFRYDQLMRLGWKVMLPLAIVNLLLVAVMTLSGWL